MSLNLERRIQSDPSQQDSIWTVTVNGGLVLDLRWSANAGKAYGPDNRSRQNTCEILHCSPPIPSFPQDALLVAIKARPTEVCEGSWNP